jgi:protein TonB
VATGGETSTSGDAAMDNAAPENNEASAPSAEERSAKKNAKGRNRAGDAGAAGAANLGELAANDAPVLPAKLVKAANPVYPPDAMRSFITGDVKAEVVVEPDGHVGEVKVLSGPKPFQQAAVEALRQYKYAPATQGGKAVASKVTEVVKFWFNP